MQCGMSRLCLVLAALLLLVPVTGAVAKDGDNGHGKAVGHDKQDGDVTMPAATPPPAPKTKSIKTTPSDVTPATPTSAPTPAPHVAPGIAKRTDAPALAAGAPALGETVGVAGISGDVRVKAKGGQAWTDVAGDAGLVPDNTVVDAREGAMVLRVAVDGQGTQQAAWLTGAIFTVHQPAKPGGVTELVMHGGNFRRCDGFGPAPGVASAAAKRRSPVVRRLWGNGHGRFRTRGRYAAAVVRGTIWSVEDRCGSTVTKVLQGVVAVRDLVRGTVTNVHAGHKLRVAAGRPRRLG
jgi:hypothetical protein